VGSRSGGPVGGGASLGMAACRWLLVILGSSPNGADTGGVVAIAFLMVRPQEHMTAVGPQ
jgi:hypothetical protein